MSEIDIVDVEDGAMITLPQTPALWPECPLCRDSLILCSDTADANLRASCRCGIWTSLFIPTGIIDYIRVTHPWGMTAEGLSFFDAVGKIVW